MGNRMNQTRRASPRAAKNQKTLSALDLAVDLAHRMFPDDVVMQRATNPDVVSSLERDAMAGRITLRRVANGVRVSAQDISRSGSAWFLLFGLTAAEFSEWAAQAVAWSEPVEPERPDGENLSARDADIVAFIRKCKGKRQRDYIKRAAAHFRLADSTIRKIWAEGRPEEESRHDKASIPRMPSSPFQPAFKQPKKPTR